MLFISSFSDIEKYSAIFVQGPFCCMCDSKQLATDIHTVNQIYFQADNINELVSMMLSFNTIVLKI